MSRIPTGTSRRSGIAPVATSSCVAGARRRKVSCSRLASLIQRFLPIACSPNSARAHTRCGLPRCVPDGVQFAATALGRAPSDLRLEDIDVAFLDGFLSTWSLNERTAFGPATTGCRATPSSGMWRWRSPPSRFNARGYWRFRPSAMKGGRWNSLRGRECRLITAPDRTTWIGRRTEFSCWLPFKPASETANHCTKSVKT